MGLEGVVNDLSEQALGEFLAHLHEGLHDPFFFSLIIYISFIFLFFPFLLSFLVLFPFSSHFPPL